jgi:hypothetical protein
MNLMFSRANRSLATTKENCSETHAKNSSLVKRKMFERIWRSRPDNFRQKILHKNLKQKPEKTQASKMLKIIRVVF